MKKSQLIALTFGSILLGSVIQWDRLGDYEHDLDLITNLSCNMVTTRAQAGSTRDVHDQIYSFLRQSSPDAHAEVIVKLGGHEFGARSSDLGPTVQKSCQIENTGDYSIEFIFAKKAFFDWPLMGFIVLGFIVLLSLWSLWQLMAQATSRLIDVHIIRLAIARSSGNLSIMPNNSFEKIAVRMLTGPFKNLLLRFRQFDAHIKDKDQQLTQMQGLLNKLEAEKTRAKFFSNQVRQARHDLKAPLSTLKLSFKSGRRDLSQLDGVIQNIEQILMDLEQNDQAADNFDVVEVMLSDTINQMKANADKIPKIKFQYRFEQLSLVRCNFIEFKRVIMNLLKNAIEATPITGEVLVIVTPGPGQTTIEIKDNGRGVPVDRIPLLFSEGASFDKDGGEGLGLFHAKQCVNKWGGAIALESVPSTGTTLRLTIPTVDVGVQYISVVPKDESLAILDDQIAMFRDLWNKRNPGTIFFTNPDNYLDWVESEDLEPQRLHLIDMNLGHVATGADVIRSLPKQVNAVLATGDYAAGPAIEIAREMGIAIIPKPLIEAELLNTILN